jgi:hypothetical protein
VLQQVRLGYLLTRFGEMQPGGARAAAAAVHLSLTVHLPVAVHLFAAAHVTINLGAIGV